MTTEQRMTRRQLLRRVAALGAGLAFAGPILAACAPAPAPAPQVSREVAVVEKKVVLRIVER